MIDRRAASAVLLAVVMLLSISAPWVGAVAAAPSGMVGVADDQIWSDLPPQTPMGESAQELTEAGVLASDHADTLEVIVTSPGRAKTQYSGGHVSGTGPVAIVFRDDVNHEGREVAVDAAVLEQIMGYQPQLARGAHESGDEWVREIEYRDGFAILKVPEFSENTVTFEGTVSVDATPANDGSQVSYQLADDESVSDVSLNLTGKTNTEWDNESWSDQRDGDSQTVSVGGSTNAEGPSSNNLPEVTLTNPAPDTNWSIDRSLGAKGAVYQETDSIYVGISGGMERISKDDSSRVWLFDGTSDSRGATSNASHMFVSGGQDEFVYVVNKSTGNEVASYNTGPYDARGIAGNSSHFFIADTGTEIHAVDHSTLSEDWTFTPGDHVSRGNLVADGSEVYAADQSGTVYRVDESGTEVWSFSHFTDGAFLAQNSTHLFAVSGADLKAIDKSDGSVSWSFTHPSGGSFSDVVVEGDDVLVSDGSDLYNVDHTGSERWNTAYSGIARLVDGDEFYSTNSDAGTVSRTMWDVQDLSVSVDGSTEISVTGRFDPGDTRTSEVDLATGDHSVSTAVSSGYVDVSIDLQEVTETTDPGVKFNSSSGTEWVNHTGTLQDGESVDLSSSVNTSILNGDVDLTVAASEGVSADAPVGQVDLDYSHDAISEQAVTYDGEVFSERYAFQRTWSEEQDNAQVTIPFDGNVVEIRELTKEINDSGSPIELSSSDYTLENESLTVDLGTVATNETVAIDLAASKVRSVNGEISVTEPTVLGDELATEITIDSYSSDFHIEHDSTEGGEDIHYTYDESWSNPQAYDRVSEDGTQALYLPNAGAGSITRISSVPIELEPSGGSVDARVQSAGAEPRFSFADSTTADSVTVTWEDTTSGVTYQLYSLTDDDEVDRGTAQSPVEFTVSNPGGLELIIYELGSGGSDVVGAASSSDGLPFGLDRISIMIGSVLALGLLLWISSKVGDSRTSTIVVFLGGAVVILVVVQSFAPEVVAEILAGGISDAIPLIIVGLFGLAFLWLRGSGGSGDSIVLNVQEGK